VTSTLVDETVVKKIAEIDKHIGMVYSGMGPDSRVLVTTERHLAA
jgi:20S proteasome alpha/beta subunit